ncbi:MAG: DUF6134 family protein [Flavitalea sp.]
MIVLFTIWLIKKFNGYHATKNNFLIKNRLIHTQSSILLILFLSTGTPLVSQHQTLHYKVIHNGNSVGKIQLQHTKDGNDVFIKVTSDIKMRFLINFQVNAEEDAHYHEGKLVYSQVHRFVNGKSRTNKSTKALDGSYQLNDDGKITSFNYKQINCTVSMMYVMEPYAMAEIYSDYYQQFIRIKKVTDHKYRLFLPDGNYNDYTYVNGVCNIVDVHHSMYTVQIQLS